MLPLILLVCFLAVPVVEIYVILQVGGLIGTWPTVALLVADSLLGAWIVRREGLRAWRALREVMPSGSVPDRELADAALILLGGSLLLTPGFVSDALGFLLVLPFTRPVLRAALAAYAKRRIKAHLTSHTTGRAHSPGDHGPYAGRNHGRGDGGAGDGSPGDHGPYGRGPHHQHRVIRGDVVDDEHG